MHLRRVTWKSYSFLGLSILLLLNIFLLDPISPYLNEWTGILYMLFIPVSVIVMVVLAILAFKSTSENKIIPIVATFLAIIGVAIIAFFIYFGANFA